jgi:hypothetical protein
MEKGFSQGGHVHGFGVSIVDRMMMRTVTTIVVTWLLLLLLLRRHGEKWNKKNREKIGYFYRSSMVALIIVRPAMLSKGLSSPVSTFAFNSFSFLFFTTTAITTFYDQNSSYMQCE